MNIYVGNLSPETSTSEVRECFETFGKVSNVEIRRYKIDGNLKGLGLIEMPSKDHGHAAIAGLHGKELDGKRLNVHEKQFDWK